MCVRRAQLDSTCTRNVKWLARLLKTFFFIYKGEPFLLFCVCFEVLLWIPTMHPIVHERQFLYI